MTVAWKTTQQQSNDAATNSAKAILDPRTATVATSLTLTADQFINGLLHQTGGTTNSVTSPTAAQIVAAIKNCAVGTHFFFGVLNQGSGAVTMVAGAGVNAGTWPPTSDIIATGTGQFYMGVVTSITPASEAVFMANVSGGA